MDDYVSSSSLDVTFCLYHSSFGSLAHFALLAVLCAVFGRADSAAEALISPPALAGLAVLEVAAVGLAKAASGHERSLSLPKYAAVPVPSKGPWLRRLVQRVKKVVASARPLKSVASGALVLAAVWLIAAYVIVCFGAPLLQQQYETCALALLITLKLCLPPILVLGSAPENVAKVYLGAAAAAATDDSAAPPRPASRTSDALHSALYRPGVGAAVGAWLGAWPIPLDWDRPWQAWPAPCVLGSVLGAACAHVVNVVALTAARRRRRGDDRGGDARTSKAAANKRL